MITKFIYLMNRGKRLQFYFKELQYNLINFYSDETFFSIKLVIKRQHEFIKMNTVRFCNYFDDISSIFMSCVIEYIETRNRFIGVIKDSKQNQVWSCI